MQRKKQRRRSEPGSLALYWGLAAVYCGALLVLGFFGDRGYLRGYTIYQETKRARTEIDRLTLENQQLTAALHEMETNPRLLERKAREDLGLARRDEQVYLFVNQPERRR